MPKINTLRYNGRNSDYFGVYITGSGTFDAAELDITAYQVPGRNGDVLISNNRYKNITVTYPAFIPKAFQTNVQNIRNWLRGAKTYARLTDTYDTDHYRMAIATGIQKFTPTNQNDAANFQISFNCKPQRFLKSGDSYVSVSSGGTYSNTTAYNALPEITFTNISGTTAYIQIVNSEGTFKLTATGAYTGDLIIDCATQNIYYGSANHNDLFTGDFPILAPGTNTITYSGVTSFKLTPHDWEL